MQPICNKFQEIDVFQIWEVINHYLCDTSYGTPSNAQKNIAFVDIRPSVLLPNVWRFYQAERLFLLKLLQYLIEFKDDAQHKYSKVFTDIYKKINVNDLLKSLLNQFSNVINATPPPKKMQNDFSNEYIRQEWVDFNLREQFIILQILLLITNDISFSEGDFKKIFELFKKHDFGKCQAYTDLLEERHAENIMKINNLEISLFLIIINDRKM